MHSFCNAICISVCALLTLLRGERSSQSIKADSLNSDTWDLGRENASSDHTGEDTSLSPGQARSRRNSTITQDFTNLTLAGSVLERQGSEGSPGVGQEQSRVGEQTLEQTCHTARRRVKVGAPAVGPGDFTNLTLGQQEVEGSPGAVGEQTPRLEEQTRVGEQTVEETRYQPKKRVMVGAPAVGPGDFTNLTMGNILEGEVEGSLGVVEEQAGTGAEEEQDRTLVEEEQDTLEETRHQAKKRVKVAAPTVGPGDFTDLSLAASPSAPFPTTTPRATTITPADTTTTPRANTTTPRATTTPADTTTTLRATTTPAGVTTPKSILKRSLEEFDLDLEEFDQAALGRSSDSVVMARARLDNPENIASPSSTPLGQSSDSVILTRQRLLSPEGRQEVQETDEVREQEVQETDEVREQEVQKTDKVQEQEVQETDKVQKQEVQETDKVQEKEVQETDKVQEMDEVRLSSEALRAARASNKSLLSPEVRKETDEVVLSSDALQGARASSKSLVLGHEVRAPCLSDVGEESGELGGSRPASLGSRPASTKLSVLEKEELSTARSRRSVYQPDSLISASKSLGESRLEGPVGVEEPQEEDKEQVTTFEVFFSLGPALRPGRVMVLMRLSVCVFVRLFVSLSPQQPGPLGIL